MSFCYYVRANTSSGFINRIESNIDMIDTLYVLTGSSSYVKSAFIGRISAFFKEHGENVEYVVSPFAADHYDGIIVRGKNVAVFDGDCVDNLGKSVNTISINTDDCIDCNVIPEINKLLEALAEEYCKVYKRYEEGKRIHDEWERIYVTNMNLSRLNSFNDFTISKALDVPVKEKNGRIYERFFGCVYPEGHNNFIDNLTKNVSKRLFIKGRPGTGKSTFMRRFASKAVSMGYDAEVYYCSFDPYSYDMVIIRELSLCVFDSTAPHEKSPSRNTDEILDFYVHSGLSGTDEKYKDELESVKSKYGTAMKEAGEHIKNAGNIIRKADTIASEKMDYEKMNNLVYGFLNEIF